MSQIPASQIPARLQAIASELADAHSYKAKTAFSLWCTRKSIENREIAMTPPEGWPGNNEKARDAARKVAVSTDSVMLSLSEKLDSLTAQELDITKNIDTLTDERRALEWSLRAELILALQGRQNSTRSDPTEAAFDDISQEIADRTVLHQVTELDLATGELRTVDPEPIEFDVDLGIEFPEHSEYSTDEDIPF